MRNDFEVEQVPYKGETRARTVYHSREFEDAYLMENNEGELTLVSNNGNEDKKQAWERIEQVLK